MIYDNPILAAKQRDAARRAISMPQPIVLVSSLDDQAQFAGRQLPVYARSLLKAADAAGWAAVVRWSIMAIPAGWRETPNHDVIETAFLRYSVTVRLRAYGMAAYGLWREPGGWIAGALRIGHSWPHVVGCTELINYVKGGQHLDSDAA